ncbi:MAG: DNA double-strand break repair nuclease NurA [Dehalococcoidales bacterium]|nr:DNA double-strand break repair nuclease NurA [Dehalococcoidales bacterium]
MSLDLSKVIPQVGGMITKLKSDGEERQKHLQHSLDILCNQIDNIEDLAEKIESSKTSWLVAGLTDRLDQHYKVFPVPPEFTVIATDGSHIDVDRHQSARCYLINIGTVMLHYGISPHAILNSVPHLCSKAEDLVITPTGIKGREQPIEGNLLGIKRSVEECYQLVKLAGELPQNIQTIALVDGSLILWSLEAYPQFVAEELLDKGYLHYIEEIRKLNSDREIALASYISFPRSTDVVNTLRVAICPHGSPDCDRYCSTSDRRDCDVVAGVRDRDLFSNILGQGDRSSVFISRSSIVKKWYGIHQIYFFYLKVEDEIARIEIPQWVAEDESLLNLVHTLVLDQCQRGQGYPVALSEAHEKAVVTGVDRENFWQFVESSMTDDHLPTFTSAKSRSKRTRWI